MRLGISIVALLVAIVWTESAAADPADQAAAALVRQMTPEEKVLQLASTAPAIPRLGLPAYEWWTEGLHGAVSREETTDFPAPIGLAATFDDRLVQEVGGAVSQEVRALHAAFRAEGKVGAFGEGGGLNVWAPNINIFRDPRWGRGQETYGEDPFLTSRMGVAYVEGLQGPDPEHPLAIATPKHFAVHSGPEATRRMADVKVSLHDLEDTYLPAFRAAVVEGHAGSVMCSYNAVNGQPACANDFLLKTKLRRDWGFQGYVASDCGAVEELQTDHKFVPDAASAVAAAKRAGVDVECIHPNQADIGKRYLDAVARGLLSPADIDQSLTRLLAARIRVGDIAPDGHALPGQSGPVATDAHRQLAQRSADESIVLLKNDGLLPLRADGTRIVVTGPLADSVRALRSNYSSPYAPEPVSVLEGLRRQFPTSAVHYVPAGASITDGDPVPASDLLTADGAQGVTARFYAMRIADPAHPERSLMAPGGPEYEATPFRTAVVQRIGQDFDGARRFYKIVYSGVLIAPETGTYRIGLKGMFAKLTLDGRVLANLQGYPPPQLGEMTNINLEKGRRYPFEIVATKSFAMAVQFVWTRISEGPVTALQAAAKDADVIVAAVGLNGEIESEQSGLDIAGFSHGDRTTLDLPADQMALLRAAKATGRKLVVVNLSGSAVNLGWAQANADAVLQAWYPGEAGGNAVARALSGALNPAARLPVTFYNSVADLPPFSSYAMSGRTYRYFTGKPLYPFGYGLSYTTFRYGPLTIDGDAGRAEFRVRTQLTNTGTRAGDEVAQLYLAFPSVPGAPRLALRGFHRVHLAPGETRPIEFALSPRELSSVSENGVRRVAAGVYQVSVGGGQPGTGASSSSTSVQVSRPIAIEK